MRENLKEFTVLPMEKSVKLGNPQERRSYWLGYLAGMIDGEGSIMILKQREHRNRYTKKNGEVSIYRNTFYIPAVTISNTNPKIIGNICAALTELGIPFHVSSEHPNFPKRGWKASMKVVIRGWKRCAHFVETISFPVFGKAPQWECLRLLMSSRMSGPKRWKEPLSEFEMNQVLRIRELNSKGTNPQRPEVSPAQAGC